MLTSSKPNRNCHPESLHGPSLWWSKVTCHMWSENQPRNSIMVSLLKRNRCKAPDTWVAFIHSTWSCFIEHHLDLNLLNLHPCYLQVSSWNPKLCLRGTECATKAEIRKGTCRSCLSSKTSVLHGFSSTLRVLVCPCSPIHPEFHSDCHSNLPWMWLRLKTRPKYSHKHCGLPHQSPHQVGPKATL